MTALLARSMGPLPKGDTVSFTIPGNPVAKGRHRTGRTFRNKLGHRRQINYTPKQTAITEALVQSIASRAMGGRPLMTGAVELQVKAILPIPTSWSAKRQAEAAAGRILPAKKPDLSNVIKLLEDGCNTIVWRDDAQITGMRLSKRYGLVPQVEAITVLTGTIDNEYRGEILVVLYRTPEFDWSSGQPVLKGEPFTINPGDRIAQAVIAACFNASFRPVIELVPTSRGEAGIGSTGVDATAR